MKRLDREGLAASVAKTAGELRLQLAHITASSQLLERMAQGERARAYLAVVNQSICRMLRSIGRMELLHRLTDENEIRVFPRLMDLGRWTAQLAQRLQSVLQGADVTLRYQGPDILLSCADEELLRQMLLELLVQAARPGDEVSPHAEVPGGERLLHGARAGHPAGRGGVGCPAEAGARAASGGVEYSAGPTDCPAARGQPDGGGRRGRARDSDCGCAHPGGGTMTPGWRAPPCPARPAGLIRRWSPSASCCRRSASCRKSWTERKKNRRNGPGFPEGNRARFCRRAICCSAPGA